MRRLTMLGCVCLAALVVLGASAKQIRNGVGGSGSGKILGSAEVRVEVAGGLSFDDVTAPCVYVETVALRTYGGIAFAGPSGLNGGAIVNECGNFFLTGYSPPNVLGFNCSALLGDDGIPTVSEFVTFPYEVSNLSLKVGSAASPGAYVEFLSYDSRGWMVELVSARIGPNMKTVHFNLPVRRIEIWSDNACTLQLDDFMWE